MVLVFPALLRGSNRWRLIRPSHPRFTQFDSGGRLFQTIDSGGSWRLRGTLAGVSFLVVDPTDSSTSYASTGRGVIKSTDGGENWAVADSGLAGSAFATIAIDPLTPSTVYGVTQRGVFKSTDAAQSWNRLDSLPAEAYDAYSFFVGG